MAIYCTINQKKNYLRQKWKTIRKNIKGSEKLEKDGLIMQHLTSLKEYKTHNLILTYVSNPDEVDTINFIKKAMSDEKIVAVPRCIKESNKLEFYKINALSDLKLGYFGIMEPIIPGCEIISIFESSFCIVPGICFDKELFRLGYGGGYYDRFLSSFKGKSVGLCYENCISKDLLPVDKFDKKVNMVITESKIIK